MYARDIQGKTLTFGVSGKLIRNSLIMFDRETGSLWSHLTGEAIFGPLSGQRLTILPSVQTTWGLWLKDHKTAQILAGSQGQLSDPYELYFQSDSAGIEGRRRQDDRLPAKERVIGVRLGGEVKAYAFSALARDRVVDDVVGGVPLVIVFDGSSESGAAYRRNIDGQARDFLPGSRPMSMTDTQTGSEWDGLTGTARSGSSAGAALEAVPFTYSFWFGWADFYPRTGLYK